MLRKPPPHSSSGTGVSPAVRDVILGLFWIIRPGNVALTALAVLTGGVSAHAPWEPAILIAAVSASLIAAGGYVINDVFDLHIDRINRPGRPLPSGLLSLKTAVVWAVLLTLCGVALSFFLRPAALAIAIMAALMLYLYAAILKRTPVFGHLTVATISGLAFVYGGLNGPDTIISLVPAVLAFGFHLGREMLKAAADREGDRIAGAETMAVLWGNTLTCRVAMIPLLAVVLLSPLPAFWGWFGNRYLVVVILAVDLVLLYVAFSAWRCSGSKHAARLATILKYDMLAGLAAVWWDRWAL